MRRLMYAFKTSKNKGTEDVNQASPQRRKSGVFKTTLIKHLQDLVNQTSSIKSGIFNSS